MEERLQKYMAYCGVASRRKCENIILEGRVCINGQKVNELGMKVHKDKDIVTVDGKVIKYEENKIYVLLNKPRGYVCTVSDEKNRPTVIDLVKVEERIYPVGRLDIDTSGIIILTNDGEVYNKIVHPREEKVKTYRALVKGKITTKHIDKFQEGIDIGDYITAPAQLHILEDNENISEVLIKIHEGKNRQIRRMVKAIGSEVVKLERISIGEINKDNLPLGKWRYLTQQEINYIKSI